jgi:PsbN protein
VRFHKPPGARGEWGAKLPHLPEARSQKLSSPLDLYLSFKNNFDMETPAFIYAIFLWFLLISVTGYSIYVGFGPPSKELKDPFEDHED